MDSKYIKKENSKKLLSEVLLSIKSVEGLRLREDRTYKSDSDKKIHEISTYEINIDSDFEDKNLNGYSLTIKKWDTRGWFKRIPTFKILIETSAPRYKSEYKILIYFPQYYF